MKKNKINIFQVLLFSTLILLSFIYALPNFYNKSPSVVIIPKVMINDNSSYIKIKDLNLDALIDYNQDTSTTSVKFNSIEEQMKGYNFIKESLDDNFYVNLTLLSTAPEWLSFFNAESTSLGLDLMGGVHFLMEVDTDYIKENSLNIYFNKIKSELSSNENIILLDDAIKVNDYTKETDINLVKNYSDTFSFNKEDNFINLKLKESYLKKTIDYAVKQNIFTLKNRVNELGVAEPIVQREGISRIVIQLPGIQDTQKAKDLIGTTASLFFKKVKEDNILDKESEFLSDISGEKYLFYKESIISGQSIIDASSGIDPENNSSIVSVVLDNDGGSKMLDYTSKNTGSLMGSIIVETSYSTKKDSDGNVFKDKSIETKVINVARVQSAFSNRFQITGLDNKDESHTLAILLRSGSLAAPVNIVEERTIGPNMGAENIENGKKSIIIGFIVVLLIMLFKYKSFGLVANFCVLINLFLLLSILSIIGATLTLPGIAGILLTVGMAVDGNVLIFERIKEEFKKKNDLAYAIKNGYDKAFISIIDANVTTFIAAFILFVFGTGPVKGFAITLSIGIITSLITSVYLSRFLVEHFYKNTKKLKI